MKEPIQSVTMSKERIEAISRQLQPPMPLVNMSPLHRIQLDQSWFFKQEVGSESAQTLRQTAQIPTNIHLDLLAHGLIPDPFIGLNEKKVQWVEEKTWVYQCTFGSPAASAKNMVLVFEGLDTFATVLLDGVEILKSDNMFVSHRAEVRELMREREEHVLEIRFENALERGRTEMERYPDHVWGAWSGDLTRTAVRKAQYHYGWDWGPKLMTCGPWKPIYLETYDARIADLSIQTRLSDDLAEAEIDIVTEVDGAAGDVRYGIEINGMKIAEQTSRCQGGLSKATFAIREPQLWWPFTHGDQPLYKVSATLLSQERSNFTSVIETQTKTMGIRKVELIQRPLEDEEGTSFFFQVNNVPIFFTGACWIPGDSFLPRMTTDKYKSWISLAKDANQSMLRVWGGGVFESDDFYDACDEMGVLVWQDFLFACANYPAHPEMLESVQREAEQNVKRLRHHASLAIWAGNNEDYLYQALAGLTYDNKDGDPESWLKSDFPARFIYEHLLPKVVGSLMPGTPYHPGSPFGGQIAVDPTIGDIHQWGVWHLDKRPYQDFEELGGRFVSEFGMQGFPVRSTVDEYFESGTKDNEKVVRSQEIQWHNKATGAAETMKKYLEFNLPHSDAETLDCHIHSTQLIQSEALSTAYRSWKRQWKGPGREHCGGLLVWQLNDCWPVTSWAVADYKLRPKMAYWAIKRESKLLTTGIKRNGTNFEGWAVNLTLENKIVDVRIRAWDVRTGKMLHDQILLKDFTLAPNRSTEFSDFWVPKLGELQSAIVVASYLMERSTVVARHVNFHEPLKEVPFPVSNGLTTRFIREKSRVWLELSANFPVKGVLAEMTGECADNVFWDDNGVDLVPGEVVKLGVTGLSVGEEGKLRVRCLDRA